MNKPFKFQLNDKIIFSILYLYFFITSFLIIPAGDDFFWWGKPGHYLLTHHFYGLDSSFGDSSDGRHLGNLLEILIMHSSIFAAIFMPVSLRLLSGVYGTKLAALKFL